MPDSPPPAPEGVLDSLTNAVLVLDEDLRVRWINRSASRLLDAPLETVAGRPAAGWLSEEILRHASDALERRMTWAGAYGSARGSGGETLPVRVNVSPLEGGRGAVVSFARLASLEHRERRRLEQERLGAVARLAEGAAHVIRNPLTGISAGVEFLGRGLSADPDQKENFQAILREVDRLDRILGDLLAITHPADLSRAPADVSALVFDLTARFRAAYPDPVLRAECADNIARPWLDSEQIRRAVWELLKNAAEASAPGGNVGLRAGLFESDETLFQLGGRVLRLDVSDSGPGLPAGFERALFEPFRSTRSGSKGLGLYIARDAVVRHGGELRVANRPDGGALASIYLPWETRNDERD